MARAEDDRVRASGQPTLVDTSRAARESQRGSYEGRNSPGGIPDPASVRSQDRICQLTTCRRAPVPAEHLRKSEKAKVTNFTVRRLTNCGDRTPGFGIGGVRSDESVGLKRSWHPSLAHADRRGGRFPELSADNSESHFDPSAFPGSRFTAAY